MLISTHYKRMEDLTVLDQQLQFIFDLHRNSKPGDDILYKAYTEMPMSHKSPQGIKNMELCVGMMDLHITQETIDLLTTQGTIDRTLPIPDPIVEDLD